MNVKTVKCFLFFHMTSIPHYDRVQYVRKTCTIMQKQKKARTSNFILIFIFNGITLLHLNFVSNDVFVSYLSNDFEHGNMSFRTCRNLLPPMQ